MDIQAIIYADIGKLQKSNKKVLRPTFDIFFKMDPVEKPVETVNKYPVYAQVDYYIQFFPGITMNTGEFVYIFTTF